MSVTATGKRPRKCPEDEDDNDDDQDALISALERIRDSLPDDNCHEMRELTKEIGNALTETTDRTVEVLEKVEHQLKRIAHSLKRLAKAVGGDDNDDDN